MKKGISRKRRVIGLLGVMAIVLAGFAFLSMGARMAHSNVGSNSAHLAEMQVEWAEIRTNHLEQLNSERAEASQNGEVADSSYHGRGYHDFHGRGDVSRNHHGHGHRGFSLLGAMFGGLINLTVLGLAGYGIYSLYKRWTSPEPVAPQARVIDEDDDDVEQEIKVG